MRKIFTILTVAFALNISAKDYVTVAQPIVTYATNGNTSTTLLALPAMIANTDEATFIMGNVLPGEVINTTDIETIPCRGVIYHVPLSNKLAYFWDFRNVINHAPTGKQ